MKFRHGKDLKSKSLKYKILAIIISLTLSFFSNPLFLSYNFSSNRSSIFNQYQFGLRTSDSPNITVFSPLNYTLYGITAPNYSISISGELGNYSWYQFIETSEYSEPLELEGTTNEIFNGTFDETMWSNLENGTVNIRFYVNNSLNEIGQVDAIIKLDILKPDISVLSPISGFYNSTPPDFSVEISDPHLDKMWYTLNTNDTKHFFSENGTIDEDAWNSVSDGQVNLNFFANDTVSNENNITVQINKDTTNPLAPNDLTAIPSSWSDTNSFNITWTNPSDSSGIIGAYYKLDSAPENNMDGTFMYGVNIESISDISVDSNGTHSIYVWLKDAVGNVNYTFYATTQLYLDDEDPASPINLLISPNSWTNINSFNLSWTNPSDLSGIIGAYYKLDSEPENNTDGIYTPGTDIDSIHGISVGGEGIHTIYIWLNDSTGNINYNNSVVGSLYFDSSDPGTPESLEVNPSSWTNINSFNLSWTNPSDLSGIVGAYYKLDSEPSNNTDGVHVPGMDIDFINDISVGTEGIHTIYVWLNDSAGNINYNDIATIDIYLDSTDPLAPSGLSVNPDTWTNINSFNFSWTNPSDLSGIVGAYYKFDTLPSGDTDGTYVPGINITVLNELTVNSNGTHIIYIWVKDSAGNIESNNYASIFCHLDAIQPSIDDNQEGDDAWRNSEGTAYDIDFLESTPSSTLDYAQYKITSEQHQGGMVLLDWTNIFQDHGSLSFTTDWTIDFNACQQGINWISVRVFDDAGNNLTLNDTFYVNKDTVNPTITINSPQDNSRWKTPPDIQITAVDTNLDSLWYEVGTIKVNLTNGVSQPLDSTIWEGLESEEMFVIHFFANDSANNLNNTFSHTIYKDTLAPRINIQNPINNSYYNTPPPILVSVFDISSVSIAYTVTGIPTIRWLTNNTQESLDQIIWNQLPQGEFELVISAVDSLDNSNETRLTLYKDSLAPTLTINSPNNNTICKTPPTINIEAFDINFDSLWYRVGITNITLSSGIDQLLNESIWNNLEEGSFTIELFSNDTLGNLNNSYRISLYKDTVAPELTLNSPLTGYDQWNEPPTINAEYFDPNYDSLWYRVYSLSIGWTDDFSLTNKTDQILNSGVWNSLDQGEYQLYIYANDTIGNLNFTSRILFKDTLAPLIFINSPTNMTYWNTEPPINITVFDPNLGGNQIFYSVDEDPGPHILFNNTEEDLDSNTWMNLDQGAFHIRIYCSDRFGQINEKVLTLYKDTIGPDIIINSPSNYSYHNSSPIFNVTAQDPNLDSIWYQYNETVFPIANNVDQILDNSIWDALEEGEFTIEFLANDSYGYLSNKVNLTLYKDTIIPQVIINSPENNTYYSSAPTLNIEGSDLNIDKLWYKIGGTTIFLQGGDQLLEETIWSGLPQGQFKIYLYANDSAGNINNTITLDLLKDTLAPILVIVSPQNNSFWNSVPILNVIAYDVNPSTIHYNVSGSSLLIGNNTDEFFNFLIWSSLSDGNFIIEFYAIDSLGNMNNSIQIYLNKDTVDPIINIIFPQPNDLFGEVAPNYEIEVIEDHLNSTWYSLIGVSTQIKITEFTGIINQSLWDLFGNGTVTIRFYANDTANNVAYNDVFIRKNIYAPIITILSPIHDQLFGKTAPNFTIYKSGPEIQSTWYTIDGGSTNFTFTGLDGIINQAAWDFFGYETVSLEFYINDSLGKIGHDEVALRKDPDNPILFIHTPINNTWYASTPFINYSVIEPNLDRVWYVLNHASMDITSNTTQYMNLNQWNNLEQGSFNLELFANDTVGNLVTIELLLLKDTLGPNITILKPVENQRIDRTAPYFELEIFDANEVEQSWYTIDGGLNIRYFEGAIGKIDETLWESLWDNLTQGDSITIRFYSSDNLGNINYEQVRVIKYVEGYIPKFISEPMGLLVPAIAFGVLIPTSATITRSRHYHSLNEKDKKKMNKVIISAFVFFSLLLIFYMF